MKYAKVSLFLSAVFAILGSGFNGLAFLGVGGTSWKEETLLHDGQKITVERWVDRGGRHEIGQRPPIKEQSLTFTMPSSKQTIIWKVKFCKDVGYADLSPIMLGIVNETPYLVTRPVGCLAYNKWARPNPPYIVFRYTNKAWHQIELQELPVDLKVPNLIISSPDREVERANTQFMSAGKVMKLNNSLSQLEFKTILREPIPNQGASCGEMISDGNNGWIGVGWFTKQPSHEACLKICKQNKMSPSYCPCDTIFNKNKEERKAWHPKLPAPTSHSTGPANSAGR